MYSPLNPSLGSALAELLPPPPIIAPHELHFSPGNIPNGIPSRALHRLSTTWPTTSPIPASPSLNAQLSTTPSSQKPWPPKALSFFVGHPEGQEQIAMSLHWPGVTDSNLPHTKISTTSWECSELVSSLDVAPTLAAIAGYDVRPNARLSFDGMNLTPVIRYGATGHGGLFFDDGTIITPTETRRDTSDPEWQMWKSIMEMGPLQ